MTTRAEPAPDHDPIMALIRRRVADHRPEDLHHVGRARPHREHRPSRAGAHPGSPPGTKGISMFLVPKFFVNADGSLGERNAVHCVSIEHKLGIHGSPTCVLAYEGAIGWLVGGERDGMRNMFTMMNNARLSVGLEGLAISERAYQQAVAYARERRQGRAPGAPAGEASAIVEHPDVRRMLMTQRAWIDAMRCLVYSNAAALDRAVAARAAGDADAARTLAGARRTVDPAHQGPVHRRRQRAHLARRPGPRRHGLRRGDRCRPALPRCPHRRHLRGHQRHPGRRPGGPQVADAQRRCRRPTCSTSSATLPSG